MPSIYQTSIGRKQIVASSGLLLILFLIGHLCGNLLIFLGPAAYNGYAEILSHLRPGLYLIEFVLLGIFLLHIGFTYILVMENRRAREHSYLRQPNKGDRSLSTQLMPFTGAIILLFVMYHLYDYTFRDHQGSHCILRDGKDYGLYGLVYNSFTDPLHSSFYILAMVCIGFHLSHAIESFCQTFGINHPRYTPGIKNFSNMLGIIVALGFSMIPVYVMVRNITQ